MAATITTAKTAKTAEIAATKAATPGRPKGDSDSRQRLICAARKLFVTLPYAKVSTRMLASHAGTNAAMIRYYFADKAGLFESMIKETFEPMLQYMKQLNQQQTRPKVTDLFQHYYQIMGTNPDLPKLVLRSMLNPNSTENRLVARVFAEFSQNALQLLEQALQAPGQLQSDVNAQMARLSLISLTVFPFLVPHPLLVSQGIELSPEFLTKLAVHNQQLVMQGIFNPAAGKGVL